MVRDKAAQVCGLVRSPVLCGGDPGSVGRDLGRRPGRRRGDLREVVLLRSEGRQPGVAGARRSDSNPRQTDKAPNGFRDRLSATHSGCTSRMHIRSSKPAGRSSPPLGWFDSIAAPCPCAASSAAPGLGIPPREEMAVPVVGDRGRQWPLSVCRNPPVGGHGLGRRRDHQARDGCAGVRAGRSA
jgi:hypothetical protein